MRTPPPLRTRIALNTRVVIPWAGARPLTRFGAAVLAQQTGLAVVNASRLPTKATVGPTPAGVPIQDLPRTSGVGTCDLDRSSHCGARALRKRSTGASTAAGKEIIGPYPMSTPDATACAKEATGKTMVEANDRIAAVEKAEAGR